MAVLLKDYMKEEIDLAKVMIMVLIHDLVEIDAGDTYAYDESGAATKREREEKAADRIFGLLPEDQGQEFRKLWEEFEAYKTPEAKYAHLLDNFQPLLLNDASGGKSWEEHGVHRSQVYKRNERIPETSEIIWEQMKEIIQNVEVICTQCPERYVYAASLSRKTDRPQNKLEALLVSVGETLNETLYARTHSVVYASATLTVDGSFNSSPRHGAERERVFRCRRAAACLKLRLRQSDGCLCCQRYARTQ